MRFIPFLPLLLPLILAKPQYYDGISPLANQPIVNQFFPSGQSSNPAQASQAVANPQYAYQQNYGRIDANSIADTYDTFLNSDVVRKSFDLTSRLLHRMAQKTPPTDEQLSFKAEPIDFKAIAQALNLTTQRPPQNEVGIFGNRLFNGFKPPEVSTLAPSLPNLFGATKISNSKSIINEELLQRLLPRIQGQTLPLPTLATTTEATTTESTTVSTTEGTTTVAPTTMKKVKKLAKKHKHKHKKDKKGKKSKKGKKPTPTVTGWTSPKTTTLLISVTSPSTTPSTSPSTTPSTSPSTTPSTPSTETPTSPTSPETTPSISSTTSESTPAPTTSPTPTTNFHTTKREITISTVEDSPPTSAQQPHLMVHMRSLDEVKQENLEKVKQIKRELIELAAARSSTMRTLTSSEELEDNIVAELGSKLEKDAKNWTRSMENDEIIEGSGASSEDHASHAHSEPAKGPKTAQDDAPVSENIRKEGIFVSTSIQVASETSVAPTEASTQAETTATFESTSETTPEPTRPSETTSETPTSTISYIEEPKEVLEEVGPTSEPGNDITEDPEVTDDSDSSEESEEGPSSETTLSPDENDGFQELKVEKGSQEIPENESDEANTFAIIPVEGLKPIPEPTKDVKEVKEVPVGEPKIPPKIEDANVIGLNQIPGTYGSPNTKKLNTNIPEAEEEEPIKLNAGNFIVGRQNPIETSTSTSVSTGVNTTNNPQTAQTIYNLHANANSAANPALSNVLTAVNPIVDGIGPLILPLLGYGRQAAIAAAARGVPVYAADRYAAQKPSQLRPLPNSPAGLQPVQATNAVHARPQAYGAQNVQNQPIDPRLAALYQQARAAQAAQASQVNQAAYGQPLQANGQVLRPYGLQQTPQQAVQQPAYPQQYPIVRHAPTPISSTHYAASVPHGPQVPQAAHVPQVPASQKANVYYPLPQLSTKVPQPNHNEISKNDYFHKGGPRQRFLPNPPSPSPVHLKSYPQLPPKPQYAPPQPQEIARPPPPQLPQAPAVTQPAFYPAFPNRLAPIANEAIPRRRQPNIPRKKPAQQQPPLGTLRHLSTSQILAPPLQKVPDKISPAFIADSGLMLNPPSSTPDPNAVTIPLPLPPPTKGAFGGGKRPNSSYEEAVESSEKNADGFFG